MQKTLLAIIAAAIVTVGLTGTFAVANHEPADKAQAAASSIDQVDDSVAVLQEKMRVDTTADLILQSTAECSILTSLNTSGGPNESTESDGAFGQVEMWITIDGTRVPVSTLENDDGEVVFCNRAYQRTVTDNEQDETGTTPTTPGGLRDGIDSEDDFIRTRNANGFNWMAFDVGATYDKPYNGNNIVDVVLHARYTRESSDGPTDAACAKRPDNDLTPYTDTCADAFVGARSLIVEATHASNHEQSGVANDGF